MTRFDDNLWREVERRYGPELSDADGPLSSGPRWRLPMIAGASLGVAGASAAAVVVLSAASSPPAYAVTTHPDGTVSVMIRRINGIPGANRRLAQLGIHVRAVLVDAKCQAAVAPALRHVTVAGLTRTGHAGWIGSVKGGVNARIRPARIARNHTLVIAAVPSKGQVRLVRGRAVRGAIPGCLPAIAVLRGVPRGVRTRIVSCAPAPLPAGHPVVVHPGANTTATNETASTGSASDSTTTTGPATTATTVPAPARARTITSGTSGSGTTTNWQTTTSPSTAGAPRVTLPPPVLQACLDAARHAAKVQQVVTGSARTRR